MTTHYEIDGSPYGPDGPTDAEWIAIGDTECLARAGQYLGYPLDLHGRFVPSLISPKARGWRAGDRTVWCGMVSGMNTSDELGLVYLPFSGRVEGADQARLYGVGTCFSSTPATLGPVVDCNGPHSLEIVGTATMDGTGPYPGAEAVSSAVSSQCEAAASHVYGGPLPQDVAWGSLGLQASSWDVGRRTVECTLGLRGADGQWAVSPTLVRR